MGRRVDQDRGLCGVERDGAAAGDVQVELSPEVGDRRVGELLPVGDLERDVDVAAAVQLARRDRAAVLRALQARCRRVRCVVRHGERDLLALHVLEAHLQLPVQGQDPHLIGHVGEEEHRCRALADLRQVRVEAAADAEVVVGEVELADHVDLPVRRDLERDLPVEELLRGVDRVQGRRADDRHRRGERGCPPTLARVREARLVLVDDLLLDLREPLVRRRRGRCRRVEVPQLERLGQVGQRLEEVHAADEVVDRQPGVRFDRDTGREADADEDAERPEL